jgi:hypothetical protein
MFVDEDLSNHLATSSVVKSQTAVIAEWNMNIASNIKQIGNYRYRPENPVGSPYQNISSTFSLNDYVDGVGPKFYTGATDSDIVVDGGFDNSDLPVAFLSYKEKEKLLYSLEDCFGRFRPRSGINKLRFFDNKYSHYTNIEMSRRPRYYMSDKNDQFKYWTSYRSEDGVELGVANHILSGENVIHDAAPFIVYKDPVPANRVVIKMQTNVGDIDLGEYSNSKGVYQDPFFGDINKTTPINWKVQQLVNDNWIDMASFNAGSRRRNGNPIVGIDGYVELSYGLIIPEDYRQLFTYAGDYISENFLPPANEVQDGIAYFVSNSEDPIGTYHISYEGVYQTFPAQYGWVVEEETVDSLTNFVTDLTSPSSYSNPLTGDEIYREFEYIEGLRIVVETMNVFDSTFDLIELSPRLTVNLSEKVTSFSLTKSASDLGVSGMPVGQLLASNGQLELFDYDQAFFDENTESIVQGYNSQNIQIKLYEIIAQVKANSLNFDYYIDYYIPLKTLYTEGFPQISNTDRKVTLQMRDLFSYFESMTAPRVFIQNASLSYAISLLLDGIGFSNYAFKRTENEDEPIIPHFTVEPDVTVAQVLSNLAVSTQYAMFFDEYNNFIVMSKNYMMPSIDERPTDLYLYGSQDAIDSGVLENEYSNPTALAQTGKKQLANIQELSSSINNIYNDGVINYTSKSIQRSYSSIKQASLIDRDKTWIYKPALLWEVAPSENLTSINEELGQQSAYMLSAIPLNTDLSDELPEVKNDIVVNNIIDFGEGVYLLPRYKGYFYANGEIIRYDAVQFSVSGLSSTELENADGSNVWISNVQEYQRYFSKVKFNGKMYATGLVRIYSEPSYENILDSSGNIVSSQLKTGAVAKHGRMQFNTGQQNADGTMSPVYHYAGLNSYWSSDENLRGVNMDVKYLFNQNVDDRYSDIYTDVVNRGTATIQEASPISLSTSFATDGSKLIVSSRLHGFAVDDLVYFYTTGSLPVGLTTNYPYYVKSVIDDNSFTIAETVGGTDINISPTNINLQSGFHSTLIAIKTSTSTVTINLSSPVSTPAKITKTGHGLVQNQKVFFTTTGSFLTGIQANIFYAVDTIVDVDNFTIKSIPGGTQIETTGTQSGTHTLHVLKDPVKISCSSHRFNPKDLVKFTTTGTLPSGITAGSLYYVSQTGFNNNYFNVYTGLIGSATISIANKAVVTFNSHGLTNGKKIRFTTSGALPSSISSGVEYFVVESSTNTFSISATENGTAISTLGLSQSGTHTLYSSQKTNTLVNVGNTQSGTHSLLTSFTNDEAKSRLVLRDVSKISAGYYVEKIAGNGVLAENTKVISVLSDSNTLIIDPPATTNFVANVIDPATQQTLVNEIRILEQVATVPGNAGIDTNQSRAKTTTRNGIIKNFLTNVYVEEGTVNRLLSTQTGTMQSSAFIMNGSATSSDDETPGFVTYVFKTLEDRFIHFGTRMRIIGKINNNEVRGQSANGAKTYYTATPTTSDQPTTISGGSGGMGVMVNTDNNNGYFFELAALSSTNLNNYSNLAVNNMVFYKVKRNADATSDTEKAIPIKLWGGTGNIIVDDGQFTGQYRMTAEANPTVYDMSVEYEKVGSKLRFFLYVNGTLVASVDDEDPLPITNNIALFVRDSSRVMFENVYALTNNYSQNTVASIGNISNSAFGNEELNANTAFQKYAMSGMIQSTYLSGISSNEPPKYKMYFEEFGTIMREAAYFNVRYDKAYPALYAQLSPTFNKIKTYTTSGFVAGSYGAEFLIFNATDTALNLDSSSGNYLRIQGVTFTQQSVNELTVDEYFSKLSDLSNVEFSTDFGVYSPLKAKEDYFDIKTSRITHGKKQFSLQAPYIQSYDDAESLMKWMVNKVMKPRRSVGVKLFATPTIQLGDVVEFNYKNSTGLDEVALQGSRFVVYSIQYQKDVNGPSMDVYLSEVK